MLSFKFSIIILLGRCNLCVSLSVYDSGLMIEGSLLFRVILVALGCIITDFSEIDLHIVFSLGEKYSEWAILELLLIILVMGCRGAWEAD